MIEYLLAVQFLLSADRVPEEMQGVLRHPLTILALDFEIMDPRECKYLLHHKETLNDDLNLLRIRYKDFKDAPPVNDAARFPDRLYVLEALNLNRQYRNHVDMSYWGHLPKHQILADVDRLYAIWDKVREAKCDYYYITVRRKELMELRNIIGYEAYYSVNLPACVPLHYFQRCD